LPRKIKKTKTDENQLTADKHRIENYISTNSHTLLYKIPITSNYKKYVTS